MAKLIRFRGRTYGLVNGEVYEYLGDGAWVKVERSAVDLLAALAKE